MSRRIRGLFNAANFWAIVLYNVLSLNSLEFAKLVARRLIFKGKEWLLCKNLTLKLFWEQCRHQKQRNPTGRCPPGRWLLNIVSVVFCHITGLSPIKHALKTQWLLHSFQVIPICSYFCSLFSPPNPHSFPFCAFFSSPPRIPSVHPLCVTGDLLRCAAGEGKGEKTSPAGGAGAGEAESRINRQEKTDFLFFTDFMESSPHPILFHRRPCLLLWQPV